MVTIETLKLFRQLPIDQHDREQFVKAHGFANAEELLATALACMKSEDRNLRVAALRVIVQYRGPGPTEGIVMGMLDQKIRIRLIALSHAAHYCQYENVRRVLQSLNANEEEPSEIRWGAYYALTGVDQNLPDVALKALAEFSHKAEYRRSVLWKLASLQLSEGTKRLLEDYAQHGTDEEAAIATRALNGYKIMNLGSLANDEEIKKVKKNCELAYGRVTYWVPRAKEL